MARWARHLAAAVFLVEAAAVLLLAWPVSVERFLPADPSGALEDCEGRLLCPYLNSGGQWCFPGPLDAVSPHLIAATLAAEDERFYLHPGVDPVAAVRAAAQNLWAGGVVSGGSTLTMQVVKLADPMPRTLLGKTLQAWDSLRLDARASKDRVLAAYLNRAPYGLNLVGCEAAARRYFGKPAQELTLPEAALLAGLPKAPSRLMPLAHPEAAKARRSYVLRRMVAAGFATLEEAAAADKASLGAAWHDFPMLAPHVAVAKARETRGGRTVRTTLDAAIQARCEGALSDALRAYADVTNGAVMVVDPATCEILARVGSADFFDTPGGGQVDACRAPRSPGSTLKPFTYGAALAAHRLYPGEMLCDGALDYGRFRPENYDGVYHGMAPADYCLKRSLNVPAVAVLERVGLQKVYGLLEAAGISTLGRPAGHYGLGLVLGSCECTLADLMGAYAMLANLGAYRPLRLEMNAVPGRETRLLPRGVALSLFAMLEQPLPYELERNLVRPDRPERVAWKTGTSTGHRDAWAFVFNRHYVVGVWLGNNSSASSPWLVGARSALPLAARIFRTLPGKVAPPWPETQGDWVEVEVCAVSRLPASAWCPHRRSVRMPRGQFLHRRCAMHAPGPGGRVVERWPGSAQGWDLAGPGLGVQEDAEGMRATAFHILEPAEGAEYVAGGRSLGGRAPLRTTLDASVAVHWFLDGRYLGASSPGASLDLALVPGDHTLAAAPALEGVQAATARFRVLP